MRTTSTLRGLSNGGKQQNKTKNMVELYILIFLGVAGIMYYTKDGNSRNGGASNSDNASSCGILADIGYKLSDMGYN